MVEQKCAGTKETDQMKTQAKENILADVSTSEFGPFLTKTASGTRSVTDGKYRIIS